MMMMMINDEKDDVSGDDAEAKSEATSTKATI